VDRSAAPRDTHPIEPGERNSKLRLYQTTIIEDGDPKAHWGTVSRFHQKAGGRLMILPMLLVLAYGRKCGAQSDYREPEGGNAD
jgi:hypothetical protein